MKKLYTCKPVNEPAMLLIAASQEEAKKILNDEGFQGQEIEYIVEVSFNESRIVCQMKRIPLINHSPNA